MSRSPTTNDNLRDLIDQKIDSLRLEVKADIKGVSDKLDDVAIKQSVSSTKVGMLIVGISLVTSGIVTAILDMLRGKQ